MPPATPRPAQTVFKRCAVCHTSDKGGGDGLGPNLFGVVGRKAATRPGFAYSPALQEGRHHLDRSQPDQMGRRPARVVPGTKMAFPGITSKKQQADVVAYLATLK